MSDKKEKKLSKGILTICIVMIVLLCVGIGTTGLVQFSKGMIGRYESYLKGLLEIASVYIDGDDMEKCIETGVQSEQYQKTQLFLNELKNTHEVEYIYGIKPLNHSDYDNYMYVITGISDEELDLPDNVYLGDLSGDECIGEDAEIYWDVMNGDGSIAYKSNDSDFGYMYTGLIPICDSKGNTVFVLAADVSIDTIVRMVRTYFFVLLVFCLVMAAIVILVIMKWLKKRVIKPIDILKNTASDFVVQSREKKDPKELEVAEINMPENDEMQQLADSIYAMSNDMKNYMINLVSETQNRQRIASELSLATDIQADMLPSIFPAFPERKEFDIFASMDPAKEVGGDFYDFFMIDDNHLGMVIADVSGKGVPAALFMMISKTLLKNQAYVTKSPAKVLEIVNNQLCENNAAEMFVTVWYGCLDLTTGVVTASNAGHEYPAIRHKDGQFELLKDKHGFVLSGMPDMEYTDYTFTLDSGDSLFVYTDGVPEATDASNELFGTDRMIEALNTTSQDATPKEILAAVRGAVDGFVKDAPQFDDLTMLSVRIQ